MAAPLPLPLPLPFAQGVSAFEKRPWRVPGGKDGMSICAMKKHKARPGHDAGPQTWGASRHDRGGFSIGGHRLSSLYRAVRLARFWLTNPSSSLSKYSTGARGCETPARPASHGRAA